MKMIDDELRKQEWYEYQLKCPQLYMRPDLEGKGKSVIERLEELEKKVKVFEQLLIAEGIFNGVYSKDR